LSRVLIFLTQNLDALGKNKKNDSRYNVEGLANVSKLDKMGDLFDDLKALGLGDYGGDLSEDESSGDSDSGYLGGQGFSRFDKACAEGEEAAIPYEKFMTKDTYGRRGGDGEKSGVCGLELELESLEDSFLLGGGRKKKIKTNAVDKAIFGEDLSSLF
jgi:hypothetical protein